MEYDKDEKLKKIIEQIKKEFPDAKMKIVDLTGDKDAIEKIKETIKDENAEYIGSTKDASIDEMMDSIKKEAKTLEELNDFFVDRGVDSVGEIIQHLISYATYKYLHINNFSKEEFAAKQREIMKYADMVISGVLKTFDKKDIQADPVMVLLNATSLYLNAMQEIGSESKKEGQSIEDIVNKMKEAGISIEDIKKHLGL